MNEQAQFQRLVPAPRILLHRDRVQVNAEDRRRGILRYLTDRGDVRVLDLAIEFAVSEVTIRTDLAILERKALLLRVHGGAVQRSDLSRGYRFRDRLRRNARIKAWISQRAAGMVEDGDSIFVSSGSTAFGLVRRLRERTDLVIFTNGLETAMAAAEIPFAQVILVGGLLRSDRSSLVGQIALRSLGDNRVQKAFVSCSALSFESGLMDETLDEAEVKRFAVAAADQVIALVDSTKFASTAITSSVPLQAVDHLLVDDLIAREHIERLRASGITVTLCGDHYVKLVPAN